MGGLGIARVPPEVAGMLLTAASGFSVAASVVCSKVASSLGLPALLLVGLSGVIMCAVLSVPILVQGAHRGVGPDGWRRVAVHGFFGAAFFTLHLLAVELNAPLGDASALQSVNVVVAALLGRAFLGEPLRTLHLIALTCSVAGALLISRPAFLFGAGLMPADATLGLVLALMGGLCSGSFFIASRAAQGISPLILAFSMTFQGVVVQVTLPHMGILDERFAQIFAEPGRAAVAVACLALLRLFSTCTLNAGAQLCPAAASSTIFMSVSMATSYVAQTLLSHTLPEVLSIVGATLMLLAVVLVALARWAHAAREAFRSDPSGRCSPRTTWSSSKAATEGDIESVASQCSGCSGRVCEPKLDLDAVPAAVP